VAAAGSFSHCLKAGYQQAVSNSSYAAPAVPAWLYRSQQQDPLATPCQLGDQEAKMHGQPGVKLIWIDALHTHILTQITHDR
jgi:hypothetical protein